MVDIVRHLLTPPFGTETTERLLMERAADEITRLREENARLQNAIHRMLSEIDYLIERETISDIRHRIAFVEARAAIREGGGRDG